jgi:O-antigen/teichoic acid export membrane protein
MHIRKAAAWALADQYLAFAIQFATSMVLMRFFIMPEELGLFSIAFAAVSLIAFLQDFGVARYVTGERELDPVKLRTAYTISLGVGWLIALLSVCLAWPLASFYGDERLVTITLVVAASYFLVPLAIVPQALRQREMDFRSQAMVGVSASIANAAVSILLAWKGHGPLALAWGAFAQQAARALVAQWRAGWMLPWPPRISEPGTLFTFAGTNTVLVTCLLLVSRAPELLIGRMLGPAAVGLFARATGLALQLRMLLAGAVSSVFYPAFRQVRDRGEDFAKPYLRVVAAFCAITWPAMAGLAVLAEPVINLLYGPRWVAAAPLLMWIALSQIGFLTFPLNADLPILLGHQRELIRRNIVDLVTAITLLALAAPFGIEAVAASRLVHAVLWMANFGPFMQRSVGFSWSDLSRVLASTAAATLAAIAPALLFYSIWSGPAEAGFLQIMASAGAGVILWLVVLRQTGHGAYGEIAGLVGAVLSRGRGEPAAAAAE